jgi:anti-anti-sigma factor
VLHSSRPTSLSCSCSADPGSAPHGLLVRWPGPDPVALADGSLVISATAPRTGVVVLRAIGEIDLVTAPAWRRTLGAAVRIVGGAVPPGPAAESAESAEDIAAVPRRTPNRLVCDLSAVTFLGARGLDVLAELMAETAEHGVELVLVVDPRGLVRRLLSIADLDGGVPVCHQLEQAVAAAPPVR